MTSGHRGIFLRLLIFVLLMTTEAKPANADSIPTKSDVVLIGVGVAAIGAAIGIGIYYAVRHSQSVTGCTVSGPNGLQLQSAGDQQTYILIGDVATVKQGERIRVSGKKQKRSSGVPQQFLAEKVTKDYGACPVAP